MFKIGDLCPLCFGAREYKYENQPYRQVFHTTDTILVESFSDSAAPVFMLIDLISGQSRNIKPTKYDINDVIKMYYVGLALSDSVYTLEVSCEGKTRRSNVFEVCASDSLLDSTTLIKYYHSDNNVPFDEIFWAGDNILEHGFRVEAGFKSSGLKPKLESESFRNQRQESRLLYSAPYTVETLTIGNASGVPAFFGDMINRIFSVDHVSINDEFLVRSDGAEVSMANALEGADQYVITIDVERSNRDIEGIGGMKQSGVAPAVVAGIPVSLSENIEDGAVLQYEATKSAFVDTNVLK